MEAGRRVCALAVALALLLAGPLSTPRGCVDCPPGCPMHARRAAGEEKGTRSPGCHRTQVRDADEVCLRSVCGRDPASRSEGTFQAILLPSGGVRLAFATSGIAVEELPLTSLAPPEPPTDPPRALRG